MKKILLSISCAFATIALTASPVYPTENVYSFKNPLIIVNGFKIINDSYNANPDSMKGFVKNVVELYENPVLVLGNMGELGENSAKYHAEIGEYINTLNKTNIIVLTVGNLAKEIHNAISNEINKKHFENTESVSLYILDNIDRRYTIFLKASRSEKFEDIIKYLKGDNL